MSSCSVCDSTFATKQAADQHKRATKHCLCPHCGKLLASSHGVQAHVNAVHSHECQECQAVFTEESRLRSHQKSKGHCYCGDCDKSFTTVQAHTAHLRGARHLTEFRCCDCDRDFKTSNALDQHLRDKIHPSPSASTRVDTVALSGLFPCRQCPREFATPHALAQHLASLAHRPLGAFACFAGSSCGATFASPSAVLHHLESGACPSGMDREQMRALVATHDVDGLVTRLPASNMSIGAGPDADDALLLRRVSGLSISSNPGGCVTPTAGDLSDWAALVATSPAHRCPFCPPERRPFRDATALRQHINSAAHSEPFISCPISLLGSQYGPSTAVRTFTTVAGLAQHLESGACVGGVGGFWEAVRYLEARFQDMGIQLRLIQDDEK